MVRLTLRPAWVGVLDLQTRLSTALGGITARRSGSRIAAAGCAPRVPYLHQPAEVRSELAYGVVLGLGQLHAAGSTSVESSLRATTLLAKLRTG